ncbi:MAG: hypothetical protein A2W03_09705 [Candidatus Aminicenantes bacterium RBG_16_63_16]|nr:MAG: hypothetical protein A2W03_09705 [Candidatus Aminicenantes bacterium RBG_16_63_16]
MPWLGILILIVHLLLPVLPSSGQNSKVDSVRLNAADKEELAEALRLKAEIGDEVWPGLGPAEIPIILYDENSEFLVGEANAPPPWQTVNDDDFIGMRYFRRAAAKPQSFAVALGARWAGSLGSFGYMSSRIPLKLGRDFHIVLILHEVFHAFQATRAPQHFRRALGVYKSENRYPFKNADFAAAWNSEGKALAGAIQAAEADLVSSRARKFLDIRDARRARAAIDAELLSFERELEWLEGLAKYVEVRFYELAAARAPEPADAKLQAEGWPFFPGDLARLRANLGQQRGDLRFYLSGMAQARLLDRLSPGWKSRALEEGLYLEDMLRAAMAFK